MVKNVRPISGEVRVVPGVGAHDPVPLVVDDFLGGGLAAPRLAVREERTRQVLQLPAEIGLALPGAVGGEFGDAFEGTFRAARWPEAARARVARAIERGEGLDDALSTAGRSVGGEATLITWVDRLYARPLSLDGAPGEMVETPKGTVLVDHVDEPYLVDLWVGMALVSSDGTLLVRFRMNAKTILSGAQPPSAVGREVARQVAAKMARIWNGTP